MTQELVMTLGNNVMFVAFKLVLPVLLVSMVVGLLISIFQAVTQIQEMTLTFVPKILVTILTLIIFGPWMLGVLLDFTSGLFTAIPTYVRP